MVRNYTYTPIDVKVRRDPPGERSCSFTPKAAFNLASFPDLREGESTVACKLFAIRRLTKQLHMYIII